jgi:DNA-binding GntR family transcriptional regulator
MLGNVKTRNPERRFARDVAYTHIQKMIAARELRAGMPVSELPIANELGISRTPTREALRQLVAEGLLEEIPARGVVVATLQRQDIIEIYELREALEVQAAQKIALRGLGPLESQNLHRLAEEMAVLIRELESSDQEYLDSAQMTRFEAADLGFHLYMLQIAGNRRALKLVNNLRSLIRIFAMRRKGHGSNSLKQIHQDHCDALAALEARDPVVATSVLSSHIQNSRHERLEQFDEREREASLPMDISAFMNKIRAELA